MNIQVNGLKNEHYNKYNDNRIMNHSHVQTVLIIHLLLNYVYGMSLRILEVLRQKLVKKVFKKFRILFTF